MSRFRRTRSYRAALLGGAAGVLLGLALSAAGRAEEGARRLSVVYDPPRFSVEVRGVGLPEVLREIGAQVGFTVVEAVHSSTMLTLSIKDGPLDKVLQQLLRLENHALLYREQTGAMVPAGGGIDRIVLFGARTSGTLAPEGLPAAAQEPTSTTGVGGTTRDRFREDERSESLVEEILRVHALPGLQEQTGALPVSTASPQGRRSAPTTSPSEIGEMLATTTRQAQRNVREPVDGLTRATDSLLHSAGATQRE